MVERQRRVSRVLSLVLPAKELGPRPLSGLSAPEGKVGLRVALGRRSVFSTPFLVRDATDCFGLVGWNTVIWNLVLCFGGAIHQTSLRDGVT